MSKKAVLVGCNYPGTKAELHGCINDVWKMHRCLIEKFGFEEDDITVLIDTDRRYMQPTGANIKRALHDMIVSASPGDVLFFHYSGHGTRLPAETGDNDDTGYDECIVPCDMNLINDDDFRELSDALPEGVSLTIVSDSCHSGGLIEDCKEQIGDSVNHPRDPEANRLQYGGATRGYEEESEASDFGGLLKKGLKKAWESDTVRDAVGMRRKEKNYGDDGTGLGQIYSGDDDVEVQNKSLSLDTLVELLQEKTGKEDIQVGSIRPTLYDTFGEDSSSKVKKFMQVMMGRLQNSHEGGEGGGEGVMGMVGSMAVQFLKSQLNKTDSSDAYLQPAMQAHAPSPQAAYAGAKPGTRFADRGVLISGCQSDQTSADAKPGGNASQAYGACSNAIQTILSSCKPGEPITNRHLVTEARRLLASQGFTQQPGLYCTDDSCDTHFICAQ